MKTMILLALTAGLAVGGCQKLAQRSDSPAGPATPAATPAEPPVAETTGDATIPARFVGEYNLNAAQCGTAEGRIVLAADHIAFFKTEAKFAEVEPKTPNSVDIAAKVSDETGEWTLLNTLLLSDDGSTLTLTGAQGAAPHAVRCPDART